MVSFVAYQLKTFDLKSYLLEIDCGPLKCNEAGTKLYQKETNDFLTYTLGPASFIGEAPKVCDIVRAFGEIVVKIQAGCSLGLFQYMCTVAILFNNSIS
jgi:hypothetical protein